MSQRRKKRTGTTRERTGCLTCRHRKKKCDLQAPICMQCYRLNFHCEWEVPRVVPSSSSSSQAIAIQPPLTPGSPAHDGPLSREVVRYYVQDFTRLLSATRENDCFLSVFLPMAFEYPALHKTIVAWAAAHLAISNPSPALDVFTIKSRVDAFSALSKSLAQPSRPQEAELACCLVLCSMDSIVGDTSSWPLHLQGAAEILRPALAGENPTMKLFLTSYDGRWLLRNFAYHDALMSVTMDRAPLILGYYWQDDNGNEATHVADSYFGFASTPIFHIAQTSALLSNVRSGVISEEQFLERAKATEITLLGWSCPLTNDNALEVLANMYRSAALLHLYRSIYRYRPDLKAVYHDSIQREVDAVMDYMCSLPSRSSPECTTLFPLFMCGAETDRFHHTLAVRDRLQSILRSRNFKNFNHAISVLEDLWKSRFVRSKNTSLAEPLDWLDILQHRGWKLSLS